MKRTTSDNPLAPRTRPHRTFTLLAVGLLSAWITPTRVAAFEFHHDSPDEGCQERVDDCTTSSSLWYKCPISCSRHLEREGSMAEERGEPEQLFNLEATRQIRRNDGSGSSVTAPYLMENNEGYITLYAVLPLLPGMAQYYYDAVEHMAHVYQYTLVAMILPFPVTTDDGKSKPTAILTPVEKPRSILLEQPSTPGDHPEVLKYLLSRQIVAGNQFDVALDLDRPTVFLVSHDGMYIERLVAPTMETLERRVKVYEHVMSGRPDL